MNYLNLLFQLKIIIRAVVLKLVILFSYTIGHKISDCLSLPHHELSVLWCAITTIVVFDDLPETAKVLMKDRLLDSLFGTLMSTVFLMFKRHTLSISLSLFMVSIYERGLLFTEKENRR